MLTSETSATALNAYLQEIDHIIDHINLFHDPSLETIRTLSSSFSEMYNNEVAHGRWDDFSYMNRIFNLKQKIDLSLGNAASAIPIRVIRKRRKELDPESQKLCLSEEDMVLLTTLKINEMTRVETEESKNWFLSRMKDFETENKLEWANQPEQGKGGE